MEYPLYEKGTAPPPFPTDPEVEPAPRRRTPARRAQEVVRRAALAAIDTGLLPGLSPLKVHLVLCGFSRSGTTMLQAMAQTCYRDCRVYNVETSGYEIARVGLRNHPYLITKRPNDIFWVPRIFDYYVGKRTQARVIMLKRDPRAILTSSFEGIQGYYATLKKWHAQYQHFVALSDDPRVLVLSYEELVRRPDETQERISAYTGMTPVHPFSRFHEHLDDRFDGAVRSALNGVRAPDPGTIDRWRAEKHADRIRELLREIPDLPRMLVQLGYEPDDTWVRRYV